MYYLFKDHKAEPGWRPVVSGCNSNTVGLSNILSDIIESVCSSIESPYEVISSEDLLSRIETFNRKLRKEIETEPGSFCSHVLHNLASNSRERIKGQPFKL